MQTYTPPDDQVTITETESINKPIDPPINPPKVPPIRVVNLASLQNAPRVISATPPQPPPQPQPQQNPPQLAQLSKGNYSEAQTRRHQLSKITKANAFEAIQLIRNPTTNQMQRIIIRNPVASTSAASNQNTTTFLRPSAPAHTIRPYIVPTTGTRIPQPSNPRSATRPITFVRPAAPIQLLRPNNVANVRSNLPLPSTSGSAPRPIIFLRPAAPAPRQYIATNTSVRQPQPSATAPRFVIVRPPTQSTQTNNCQSTTPRRNTTDRPNDNLMRRVVFLRILAEYMVDRLGLTSITFGEHETHKSLMAQFNAARSKQLMRKW